MKVKTLRVRVLIAALAAVLTMPMYVTAGSGITAHSTSPVVSKSATLPVDPTFKVSMTAYNAVAAQTDSTPDTTSIGVYTNPDIVAARSSDLASKLPYGTVIQIVSASSSPSCGYGAVSQDVGLRVIADAMNAKEHKKIDILLPSKQNGKNPAITLGVCKNVTIKVVGHISTADMPQTQSELAAALDASADYAVAK